MVPLEIWHQILRTFNIFDLILLRSASKYLYNLCQHFISEEDVALFDQQECLIHYAKNGFSTCLEWARKLGYYWTASLCAAAAEYDRFDTLKMLRRNGCDWNEDVCANAAENGNLEMLKWARENGCEYISIKKTKERTANYIHD